MDVHIYKDIEVLMNLPCPPHFSALLRKSSAFRAQAQTNITLLPLLAVLL